MENQNNIDKLFSDESAKDEANTKFPAFEKVWENVEQRLDKKDNRTKIFKIWLPYSIAASLAILFGSLYLFNNQNQISTKSVIAKSVPVKNQSVLKENLQTNSQEKLPEISSSNYAKAEKFEQKFKAEIQKNPLKTNEVLAYQIPKTETQNSQILGGNSKISDNKVATVQEIVFEKTEQQSLQKQSEDSSSREKSKDINEVVVTAMGKKREAKSLEYRSNLVQKPIQKIADSAENSEFYADNEEEYKDVKINFQKGSEPLYIVDGYVADNNFLKSFNVKKIYSLNIIEGKSAVKFYGNNGRKGVVLITTKGLSKREESKLQEISRTYEFPGKVN